MPNQDDGFKPVKIGGPGIEVVPEIGLPKKNQTVPGTPGIAGPIGGGGAPANPGGLFSVPATATDSGLLRDASRNWLLDLLIYLALILLLIVGLYGLVAPSPKNIPIPIPVG